jgi:hypothetical protein
MSVKFWRKPGQVLSVALVLAFLGSCSPGEDKIPGPPLNLPLSRSTLGYGVVKASYTRVMNEPGENGVSLGYVRERGVVKILERRFVGGEKEGYWVLIEGNYTGWLPEDLITVYDTEEKAVTAQQQASR